MHAPQVRDHTKLLVWQKGCDVVVAVYELTRGLPDSERFGLSSQMQRAAVSIPSNVAEGAARESKKDLIRFLNYAAGSTGELQTQLHLSTRLGYLSVERVGSLRSDLTALRRMIVGLIRSIRQEEQ